MNNVEQVLCDASRDVAAAIERVAPALRGWAYRDQTLYDDKLGVIVEKSYAGEHCMIRARMECPPWSSGAVVRLTICGYSRSDPGSYSRCWHRETPWPVPDAVVYQHLESLVRSWVRDELLGATSHGGV